MLDIEKILPYHLQIIRGQVGGWPLRTYNKGVTLKMLSSLLIALSTLSYQSKSDSTKVIMTLFRKQSLEKILAWVRNGREKKIGHGASLCIQCRLTTVKEVTPVCEMKPGEKPQEGSCEQYQSVLFDPMTKFLNSHGIIIPDGKIDRVYTAAVGSNILILNHTRQKAVRSITVSTGDIRQVSLDGNSITEIKK